MDTSDLQKELDRIKNVTTGGALELLKAQIEIEKLRTLQSIDTNLDQIVGVLANWYANGIDVNNHH